VSGVVKEARGWKEIVHEKKRETAWKGVLASVGVCFGERKSGSWGPHLHHLSDLKKKG
jgi:hypothetical protein